jgi:hypothetical protein
MSIQFDVGFLARYEKESAWAANHGISQRTVARYRATGLPFLTFGGFVWIPKAEAEQWIASRIKRRRNPSRRRHQATAAELGV